MNKLQIFNNPEFGQMRTIEKNGEPWFVGRDVASALGYKDTVNALKAHVDDDDKGGWQITTTSGSQEMTIINESGLYSLVLSSKLPTAKRFKRWVTSEVLPMLRKTGQYKTPQKAMSDYQAMMATTRKKNADIREALILERMANQYEGTYRQILHAHATKVLTGEFLLPLPKLEQKTFSAEEIGQKIGISAHKVGQLANKAGLKNDKYGQWFKDKARSSEKEVSCFRYYETVIPILCGIIEKEE